MNLAASFETAVVDQLLNPLPELVDRYRPIMITASGGVAANTLLRRELASRGRSQGVEVLLPDRRLTTDNAAMIAYSGQIARAAGRIDDPRRLDARAREVWQPPGMRRRSATV